MIIISIVIYFPNGSLYIINYRIVINFNWYDDNKINPIDINNFEWKEI